VARWPERETVNDQSQGVQLAKLQELVRYWGTDYDWRKVEAKLNALPQFVTEIDGLDIQFIHVRSRHPNALPLIMTHGWPGSPLELLKVIGPLTDPTAYGGRAEDAFDLVLPTYPGYGFSGKPRGTDWGPSHVASAWDQLMRRLGYTRYVSQGGDWGAIISEVMAVQAPPGLLGIHINMPGTVPPSVLRLLRNGDPAPAGFSDVEKAAYASLDAFYRKGFGYADMMNTRPQTLGYGLADSPVGMAAFFYDKFAAWTHSGGQPEQALTPDEMLDDITLYWLTNTGTSSSRSYWDAAQGGGGPFNAFDIRTVPVAVTIFPGEIYRAPRSWAEQSFHKLIYWNEVDKGGHFAAWEQPDLFAAEIREAFRSLRTSGAQALPAATVQPNAPAKVGRSGNRNAAKPTIVLVHGAFADATGWQHVIPLLERDGYTVIAVQNSLASLAGDVETTKRVIDAQKGPVVAVGHSYGGAVITGAAAGNANVKALVYIAAFAPEAGEPIGAFGEKYPSELGTALRPDAAGFVYIDRAQFRDLFAKDVSATEASVMAATQKPVNGSAFGASVEQAAWKTIPSWYLVAQEDRAINPDLERFYAKRMGAKTTEIKSSHVPFVSHPEEVVRLIQQAASAVSK
jgi:pimeloyl-ACP methyl ester carboxylesterase